MQQVRVAADHWNFELAETGETIVPFGGNILNDQHPGQHGTLFDSFDADDCERRLAAMAECGLNVLRQAIGVNRVYDPATGLKSEGLKNWDTFIALAEKHHIYLMPVGGYIGSNDWFDVANLADNGAALDESCDFWRQFCGHYKNHPTIWAWDLRNELLYDNKDHFVVQDSRKKPTEEVLKGEWPNYLASLYGTVECMNRSYQTSAFSSFDEVPGSIRFEENPWDQRAYDFRNYLNLRGYYWCKRQCDVIREVSPESMIVSGNNGCFSPDQDLWLANGFHNHALHELFDFVTFHPYPAWQACPGYRGDPLDGGEAAEYWFNSCVAMARIEQIANKPVVVQEFGWYGGGGSRFLCDLPHRSEEEHRDYMRHLMERLMPHVNGFINWPTMDMPEACDISNHGGIFTADAQPKALAQVYQNLSAKCRGAILKRQPGTTIKQFSLRGLYTSRPYQDEMWDDLVATISQGDVPDISLLQ